MNAALTTLALFATLFPGCTTIKDEVYSWIRPIDELRELFREEAYPAPEGPLFVNEPLSKGAAVQKQTRWCFVGDTGEEDFAQKKVADLLLKKGGCERIYHLGDIVYPEGVDSVDDPELSEKFLEYQAPFQVPYYLILGNHDYYSLNVKPWFEVAKRHENLRFPYYYYGHKSGPVCLVALDTTPIDLGTLEGPRAVAQTKWLESLFAQELSSCQFKILIAHHPYFSHNQKRQPEESTVDFYERHILGKFDLAIAGHDHILAYGGNFKGTEHYISGTGGQYTGASDRSEDFEEFVGDGGPGVLYLDILGVDPFQAKVSLVILESENLDQKRVIFEKSYPAKIPATPAPE